MPLLLLRGIFSPVSGRSAAIEAGLSRSRSAMNTCSIIQGYQWISDMLALVQPFYVDLTPVSDAARAKGSETNHYEVLSARRRGTCIPPLFLRLAELKLNLHRNCFAFGCRIPRHLLVLNFGELRDSGMPCLTRLLVIAPGISTCCYHTLTMLAL